ncbi:MAG: glutathione S-transferase family protein [Methylococcaceae bacterium]
MLTLYQFPISHYCEKIRWTLAYKKIDHKIINLLPGLHVLKTNKLASQTSVPILVHDDKVIQGSSEIITYLDEEYPEQGLTPNKKELKDNALEWEKYIDNEVGIHVRRCCYHILLEHPDIVIKFFVHQGPWYGKPLLRILFPKLKTKMRGLMNINEKTAETSKQHLSIAIDKIYKHLQEHSFFVGDQFSRADLAAASLIAPLRMQEKYGLNWPKNIPEQLEELIDEFNEKTKWVDELYKNYR